MVLKKEKRKVLQADNIFIHCILSQETWLILSPSTESYSSSKFQPVTFPFQDSLPNYIREAEQQDEQTTDPSVFPVIWATLQPGRNHGKGPGKRWVYCLSILLDVTDACDLTRGLFFFRFIWFSGNILWEHPICSIALLIHTHHIQMCLL